MLTFISDILEILSNIPAYILYAIESLINLFFVAVEGLATLSYAVLGGLPEVEAPEYITAINWFFPIGGVLAIAAPLVTAYITWLGVRWIFQKIGEVG